MGNILGKLSAAKHQSSKVNCNAMSEKLDISFLPFGYISYTFSIYSVIPLALVQKMRPSENSLSWAAELVGQ